MQDGVLQASIDLDLVVEVTEIGLAVGRKTMVSEI